MNVNRKRLRNKMRKMPAIQCPEIKKEWEAAVSTRRNLEQMGLTYDPNHILQIPNPKEKIIEKMKQNSEWEEESLDEEHGIVKKPIKSHVAEALRAEAYAPRERLFRLPNSQVQFLTYLMDKYGEDYKAMTRDKKNYNQLTWKQIRAKIKIFKGIPEQYNEYLQKKISQS